MLEVSKKTDFELITTIKKTGCNESFLELFERHKKIYFNVCSSYSKLNSYVSYNELLEDSHYVLGFAVQKFNEEKKAKFSTWLFNYSTYHCLNVLKGKNKERFNISQDLEEIDFLNNKNNNFSYSDEYEFPVKDQILSTLEKMNDKRIRKIFELRYFDDSDESKWRIISKKMSLTPQRVLTLHNLGKNYLKKNFEKSK